MALKKFTILHSNDMHGDFFSKSGSDAGRLVGGLALLSAYVTKVRAEEENVLYVIAGDMVQGSLIDSEYRGISTMEIMNYLSPDVVALGNHEFDYGLSHLLFLEKMANFPIVNANLYIKNYNKRLMQPYLVLKVGGFSILFTGIITEKIMDSFSKDDPVRSFVTLEEASVAVGHIANAYKNDDIDLTILLTHLGLESDRQLAQLLDPAWGVDVIIGGHSHSLMAEPESVNGVLIAHAGVGTKQIGRFDITVDDEDNRIVEYQWQLIPISDQLVVPDQKLLGYLNSFKEAVDQKYNVIACKLARELTHPAREQETELGNLFADAFAEAAARCDVILVGSGSIRSAAIGPMVTMGDLLECFPYDDILTRYAITGAKLKRLFGHIMRAENRLGEGECYQVNADVHAVYDDSARQLAVLEIRGEPVGDQQLYTICLQGFHANNSAKFLGITSAELIESGMQKVISTSARDVLTEYLRNRQNVSRKVEGRLIYTKK